MARGAGGGGEAIILNNPSKGGGGGGGLFEGRLLFEEIRYTDRKFFDPPLQT